MAGKSRHTVDHILIEAIGRGRTQTEAASLAGVSARTVGRRLDDPEFLRRVSNFRDALVETGAARLGDMISLATETLEKLLADDVSGSTRLAAARTILDSAFRFRELANVEKRLSQLEQTKATSQLKSEKPADGGQTDESRDLEARRQRLLRLIDLAREQQNQIENPAEICEN